MLVHFIHAHIRVRPHTYTSAFPHEGTCTFVRAHPRENAHAHARDAYRRARADMHAPWHTWARLRTHPRMNTHVCTRTRANTPAHAHMRTHPRYTHARSPMQACARTMHMHAYARGTCTHAPAQCTCMRTYTHARTRLHMCTHSCKHTPTNFGCALTDWGHTPHQ